MKNDPIVLVPRFLSTTSAEAQSLSSSLVIDSYNESCYGEPDANANELLSINPQQELDGVLDSLLWLREQEICVETYDAIVRDVEHGIDL